MPDAARMLFQAHAAAYDDALRRRLIPPYAAFYGAAVAALVPGHTSRASRSAYVSRRVTRRASPRSANTTAGRVTPL